jgi:SWI/SNF-related matrix-associated actin-dependent regulator 1 of chromatin subfamily A
MSKIEDRPYQDKAVRKIEHFKGRALIACEMRMGKTFIALKWLQRNPEASPAVVVCPEIGKLHWEEKAQRHFSIRSVVLNGTSPPERKFIHNNQLYILNWEILQYWVSFLQRARIKSVILDEVHYIKESRTQCYKATKALTKGLPYLLALGGTPAKSRPAELFNILNLLRPDRFPSFWRYGFRYCKPSYRPWGIEFKGASHLDELHTNLNAWCMVRMLRKDFMHELPKDRRLIPIELSDTNEYHEAETSFIKWLSKRSITRAKKAKKAERLVQMGYLKRLAVTLKLPGVLKWIDRWLDKKKGKLVVFAIHKEIIQQLAKTYKGKCVVVDGNVRGKKRQLAVKTFQTDPKCRLFIGNTKAAGTVIELSKGKAVVMIEFPWTPGDLTQCEDRIFDQKKKKSLRIYYLVGKDTIEHHLCEVLQTKQDVLSETFDGDKAKNRLSIFDQLQQKLLAKG